MYREEFTRIFNVFSKSYSHEYSVEQLKLLYEYVKDIAPGQLQQALDELVEKNNRAPAVAVIRESTRKFVHMAQNLKREREMDKVRAKGAECPKCLSTGLISALKHESTGLPSAPYAFRCDACNVAGILKLSANIPLWEQRHESMFAIMKG